MSDAGGVYLSHTRLAGRPAGWSFDRHATEPDAAAPLEANAGLAVRRWQPLRWFSFDVYGAVTRTVVVPHWVLAALFAAWPAVRLRRRTARRRRRRERFGYCEGCGYDLRTTPDRCPECGRAAVAR